jgi:hypothetical protein
VAKDFFSVAGTASSFLSSLLAETPALASNLSLVVTAFRGTDKSQQ